MNTERLDALKKAVAWSDGFQLILITADAAVGNDLVKEMPELALLQLDGSKSPVEMLMEQHERHGPMPGAIIAGVEVFIDGDTVRGELRSLNLCRDLLKEWVDGPLILIASEAAMGAIYQTMPDFYTWRAFETKFVGEEACMSHAVRDANSERKQTGVGR